MKCFVLFLLVVGVCCALDHPFTQPQQERAERLYTRFLAPCCWRQSVAEHRSAEALAVRNEIDESVAAGHSDEEIKEALVHKYGHGILVRQEGSRKVFLYVLPFVATLGGFMLAIGWLKRRSPAAVE